MTERLLPAWPLVLVAAGLATVGLATCRPPEASSPGKPATPAVVSTPAAVPAPAPAPAARTVAAPRVPLDRNDPLARAVVGHPRLFAGTGEFARVAASTDPAVQASLQALAAEAALLRQRPVLERHVDGFRLLAVSRAAVLRVGTLAAAYRMLGDGAAGQAARENLLAIARFSDWNPRHYLDVGEMTLAAALGYDWCHDLLTAEERAEVRAAIVTKGIMPSFVEPAPFWVAGETNWTQVCHAGLVAGALAIHEDEPDLARRTVVRALQHLPKALDAIYDPTGNYPEGPMYWGYGTIYTIIVNEALRSVLGDDGGLGRHAGLLASGQFFAHGHGATGQPFCYGDCSASAPAWMYNAASLSWLARENRQAAILPVPPQPMLKPSEDANFRFLPFLPLWLLDGPAPGEPLPLTYVGGGLRQVWISRQAWGNSQAAYVGVTAGSPGDPHGHMDTGSFVFESDGVRWAHDLGMHPYEPLEKGGVKLWDLSQNSPRWTVFRLGADAHNILRLPGVTQQVQGRATLVTRREDPASPGCDLDLTSVYAPQATRVQRQVRFPNRAALEVTDRIEGLAVTGTIRWQLLTRATVTVDPGGRVVHLQEAGKSLDLTVLEPADVRLTTAPADPYLPSERPNPGYTRVAVEVAGQPGAAVQIRVRLGRP